MDDFKNLDMITVREGDLSVPYTFEFPICSAAGVNDGAVPYGVTISSAIVTATLGTTDATDALVASSSLLGIIVTVHLDYPTALGPGTYHLNFGLTFSDSSVKNYVFERVTVV